MLMDVMKERVKAAMRSKDEVEKNLLRVVMGDVQTEEARQGGTMDDAGVQKVLKKVLKGIEETLAVMGDSPDRAKFEREKSIIEGLLPQTLSVDGIVQALGPVAGEIRGAGNDGQAIGMAVKHLKSTGAAADGKDVATAVRQIRGA